MRNKARLGGLCTLWLLAALIAGALAPLPGLAGRAYALTCSELLADGGFEAGGVWQLGPTPVMPQYVTYASHSGSRSLVLGITSGANVESFSSARQTVTLPADATQITLSFWAYAMADSPATTDYMEVVLLNATGTTILNKPWQSHNDSRLWNRYAFDLTAWRGQTVQVYFNVYNDGLGGRAAMFLDDVSLQSCSGSTATPTATGTGTAVAPATSTATPTGTTTPATPTATPTGTAAPAGCVDLLLNGGFDAGLANWQPVSGSSSIVSAPDPVHTGPNALQLGSLTQNLTELASVRQLVTIPTGYAQVTLEVWVYELSQDMTNADYQKIELLNSSGGPWLVLSQGTLNNAAWRRLTFDLTPFSGTTLFVNFAVNNDGVAGRTAMYVDDVRLRACNPGPATPTATPSATSVSATATPTVTSAPGATATPISTLPPGAGCVQLIQNPGFETGVYPWLPGRNELPAQIVTAPYPGGAYAVGLGALAGAANVYSYSSLRQWVTIPVSHPRVIVSFWAYTRAESLWGADRQQFVVLGAGDAVLAVPWKVLENEQVWRQRVFEVFGVAGQTIGVYFNVINDGAGGRTSMFLDEVYVWACTPGAYPASLASSTPPGVGAGAGGAGASSTGGVTVIELPAPTPAAAGAAAAGASAAAPAVVAAADTGAPAAPTVQIAAQVAGAAGLAAAAAPAPLSTRVALDMPDRTFVGQVLATDTPAAGIPDVKDLAEKASKPVATIMHNWPQGWQWVVLAIVLILIIIVIITYLHRRGQPS